MSSKTMPFNGTRGLGETEIEPVSQVFQQIAPLLSIICLLLGTLLLGCFECCIDLCWCDSGPGSLVRIVSGELVPELTSSQGLARIAEGNSTYLISSGVIPRLP